MSDRSGDTLVVPESSASLAADAIIALAKRCDLRAGTVTPRMDILCSELAVAAVE